MIRYRRTLQKYQPYILPIGIFVCSILWCFLFIVPFIQRTIELFRDVNVVRSHVEKLQEKSSVLATIDELQFENQLNILTSAVPIEPSLATILITLEQISERSGAQLISFTIESSESLATQSGSLEEQKDRSKGQGTQLPFSVVIGGSFEQIQTFLRFAHTVRRFFSIHGVRAQLNEDDNQLRATLSVDAFYLPLSKKHQQETLRPITDEEYAILSKVQEYQDMGNIQLGSADVLPNTPLEGRANPFSLE